MEMNVAVLSNDNSNLTLIRVRAFHCRADRIPKNVFRSARLSNQLDRKAVQIAEA